jgi:hypothetical protein
VVALEVFGRINVFGFFLLRLYAGAFLTGGFRHALIFLVLSLVLSLVLGTARGSSGNRKGKNQESRNTIPRRAEGGLYGSQAADPG